MSLNGIQIMYPNSLDGLQINNTDQLYVNGQLVDPTTYLSTVSYNPQTINSQLTVPNLSVSSASSSTVAIYDVNKNLISSIPSSYISSITSDIQAQLNSKAGLSISNTFSSSNTFSGATTCNSTLNVVGLATLTHGQTSFTPAVASDLVNKTYVDTAIAGIGAGILNLNNTWTGTNQFNQPVYFAGSSTFLNSISSGSATLGQNNSTNLNRVQFTGAGGVYNEYIYAHTGTNANYDAQINVSNTTANPTTNNTGQMTIYAGSVALPLTSIGGGVAPPSTGISGGTGDRLILYPGNSTGYPYSLGIDANTLWYSCPTGQSQKWYVGGTNYMTLNSGGTLVLTQASGGDQLQLINNSANAMYMNFNSNGGAGIAYIGMDNSGGTGLFGSGIPYAFDIGTATATPICFFTNNVTTPRMKISATGDTSISGNLTMNLSQVFYLYYLSTTNYANMYADSSGNINFSTGTAGVTNRLQIGAGGGIIANTPITINGGGGTALIVNTSAGNPMVINGSGTDANILYNCSGAGGRQYYVGSGGTGSGGGGGNWYVYDSATGSCMVVQGSTGATGLGTNSPLPGYRLHVQGNAYMSGNIFTYGYISCLSAPVYTNTVASQLVGGVSQPLTLTCNIYPVCTLSSQISLSVSQQWNTYGSQLTFVPGSSASATLQNGSSILFTNGQNTGSFQLMTYGYGTANYYTTFYIYWVGGAGVYLTAGANTWSSSSDSRIKENIITMTDGLSNILKLRPVYYNFLNDKVHLPMKKRHGFIAQEYQLVYPELTDDGEHPPYKDETTGEEIQNPIGIQTTDLIADLVCAVQEHDNTITAQATQITTLQNQLLTMQNDIKNLHSALNTLINSINAGKNNISQ